MADMFELRNAEGDVAWTGNDRKAIRGLELPPGDYTLWKFQGTLPVRVVPARVSVAFQSASKKGPRKRADASGTSAVGEPVSGEPIT